MRPRRICVERYLRGMPADCLAVKSLASPTFLGFADVVYLMPPLVIGMEDLATLTAAVRRVVSAWSEGR